MAVRNWFARLKTLGLGVVVGAVVSGCAAPVEAVDPDLLPVACLEGRGEAGCSSRQGGYVFDYKSGRCRRQVGASCTSGTVFETEEACRNTCGEIELKQ